MTSAGSRPLRVLARPYRRTTEAGQIRIYDEMVARGHVVEEFSWRALLSEPWDIVHTHYPESVVRRRNPVASGIGALLLTGLSLYGRLFRRAGVAVSTGHNVSSHEGYHPWMERMVVAAYDRSVGGMTFPSETARTKVIEHRPRLAGVPNAVVPLVNYRFERGSCDREAARTRRGIEPGTRVVLFLGQIRPYKNVPHLISVFREAAMEDARLIVAGRPSDDELDRQVREAIADDPSIDYLPGFVDTETVTELMAIADVVAAPFSEILNSASTLLALSHDRPVLVPKAGALSELADRSGHEWFTFFEGRLQAEDLRRSLDASAELEGGRPDLSWCDVGPVTDATVDFYSSVRGSG